MQALKHDIQIINRVDVEKDERLLESKKIVSDDAFFKYKEFITILYNFIGKKLRKSVQNITPENEQELMANLKEDIKREVEKMTPARGRQLLNEARIMVLPGWDLSASYIFDSLIMFGKKDMKLDMKGVKDLIIGSRFVEDGKSMLL